MAYSVEALAKKVNGTVIGDGSVNITDAASLDVAGEGQICFAINEYAAYVPQAKASAVIVEKEIPQAPMPLIIVDNAKKAFIEVLNLLRPPVEWEKGIHETALIGKNVTLGKDVTIGAYCMVCDNVTLGDGVILHPYTYVGHNTTVGENSVFYVGSVVHENCQIGKRVILRAHAVIGGEGFGFATENGVHTHIPQVGNVILEDDVEVGSCSCIDNGTMGSTIVRRGTKIDNLVHLGHNVEIGEDCFLIAQVGIAGSTKCGNHVTFAGQTGCTGHITIGDNIVFAGKTGITGNVPNSGMYAGYPLRPHKEWLRISAHEKKLPDLVKTVKELQKEVAELKAKLP